MGPPDIVRDMMRGSNGFSLPGAVHDACPDTYIRPDHGRMVWDETGRPGYGLYDRVMGAAYLNGLWKIIQKMGK